MTRKASLLKDHLARYRPMPLTHVVGVTTRETPAVMRRRRQVVAATTATGAAVLGISLSSEPGSRRFYLSSAAVAATWIGGGIASGPLHLGWIENRDSSIRRPLMTPLATGVGSFGVFYGAALIARRIPVLNKALRDVLRYADEGEMRWVYTTTLANGLGEEIFFRGALYTLFTDRRPVITSTATYALATTTTRNPALVLAATVMGTLFGLQRRASGGVQAPALTHLTWSTLMLRYLPPVFRESNPVPMSTQDATTPSDKEHRHMTELGSKTGATNPHALPLLTPLGVRIAAQPFMPRLLPRIVATDKKLLALTKGKLSLLDIAGLPNITLTTVGRKSGLPRPAQLLAVPRADGSWLTAGSNFGQERQPIWVLNVEANPNVEVTRKGRTTPMFARKLEGDERATARDEMLATWPNIALYEKRTEGGREIKIFHLTPR